MVEYVAGEGGVCAEGIGGQGICCDGGVDLHVHVYSERWVGLCSEGGDGGDGGISSDGGGGVCGDGG